MCFFHVFRSPPVGISLLYARRRFSQAAREAAENRARALEDRLAALGREGEKASSAEAGAAEQAAARARDKVSTLLLVGWLVGWLVGCLVR